ncbi:MAG: hypothetical protein DWB56_06710 [Candidatus Jettenia sp.]|uniref:Phage tail tape measure protein n=1 Tax=Candidatus Jettenia caeni TaxID=247490 RepID=I3IN13_9BACT|nr:phage tail tape measure protein [Candidatus Jettenia sp. AMX1]MBC6928644.1 hypothetical protein [Candidatus Jettenia sp.]GAB63108.1 conserved hypothetical protein [Candidatus Jettenia caeni]KAA0250622.1 MAG: hypothetical protein EDM77_03650 [Candidatus Jettenia sp. AMX1]MCE7879956.1 hypothetical protein [Candidatus Jettenia sp. AMX1]MCQ3926738.1 hypothetical protein [Candidatus Jettenia sp.]
MSQRVEVIIGCINDARKALQEVTSSFQSFVAKIAVWNYSLRSAYQGVEKVLDILVVKTADVGDSLYKMSQKTGISVEELYKLKSIAELSDVSLDELAVTFGVFSKNLLDAKTKAGDASTIFKALGIDTAKPLNQILYDLAKRFSEMQGGEEKMALAMQLFGRNGQNIIPVLNDLASGMDNITSAFTEESAQAASVFNDNITTLKRNLEEFSFVIGNELIPKLNTLFDVLNSKAVKSLAPLLHGFAAIGLINKGINTALDYTLGKEIPEINPPIESHERKIPPPDVMSEKKTQQMANERRKWMEWEWAYADTVDRAGQEILDSYEKRDRAVREHTQTLQAAREAEINLQLKEIDLAEQEFRISKAGAAQERIRLNEELLRIQAEYLAQLDKIKDPASWYAQKNAIDQTKESLVQLNFVLKEQTGTFGDGLLQGINAFTNELNTAFQHGVDFAGQSAQAIESVFSDVLFDAMRGELQSFGDYWRNFSQSIMRMISEMVVKMLMMKALMAMGFGAMGSGAGVAMGTMGTTSPASAYFHKGGYIPRFHAGGLLGDEVPAILQKGEYVVSRKGVEGVGVDTLDRINRGKGVPASAPERAPTIINHITVQAMDAESFAVFAQKNKGILANAVMSSANNNHPIRRGR